MSLAISLLPLALLPVVYALYAKAAAFLFRRTRPRWSHALMFGVIAVVVGVAGTIINRAAGLLLPTPLALLMGLASLLAVGVWYLGPRAITRDGSALQFKGGVLLSLVAYALIVAMGVAGAILIPLLQHFRQA